MLSLTQPLNFHKIRVCVTLARAVAYGIIFCLLTFSLDAFAATSIPFTITTSEAMNVTGTPRIAVDVGGVSRFATYTSGTGTSSLTFTYTMVAGDVDLDGVTLTSPMQLNGGTIKDLNGNDATLTFVVPNTSNVKVNYPSLGMDFINDADGRYTLNGTIYNDLTSFISATSGSFTRATTATYFDSAGTLQTAASGVPRFDWDPDTHVAKGLLIEEGRTNLLRRSSEFDNAVWGKQPGITVTPNTTTAPDGTLTADTFTNGAMIQGDSMGEGIIGVIGQLYTFSVWMKTNTTTTAGISLGRASNNPTVAQSVNLTNQWQRFSISWTLATNTTLYANIYSPSINNTLYIWGAQLEQGAFSTSYIPTVAATATRNADDMYFPIGAWFDTTKGTVSIEFIAGELSQQSWLTSLSNGVNNGSGVNLSASIPSSVQGGVSQFDDSFLPSAGVNIGIANKAGFVYSTGPQSIMASGYGLLGNDSPELTPNLTRLNIGHRGNFTRYLNGWVKKLKYYPARASSAQLQLMTQ